MADEDDHKKKIFAVQKRLTGQTRDVVEHMYNRYHKEVLLYLTYRLRGDQVLASELMQEVIFRICEKGEELPVGPEAKAWSMGFAKNVLLEYFRERKKFRSADPESYDDASSGALVAEEVGDQTLLDEDVEDFLRLNLTRLTPQQQMVFMHVFDGWTVREIGVQFELSDQTVHNHLYSARRTLKKLVIKYFER